MHSNELVGLFGLVELYAVYTYVNDLNTTKCSCAIDKQPKLNKFMKGYVYLIYLISIILGIIIIITLLAFLKIKFIK